MKKEHWSNTPDNFLFAVSADFVLQIKSLADSQKQLADKLRLSKGRISQTLNDPGNLTLKTMVKYARALGMKLGVVLYEDKDDPNNTEGPIHSDIFRLSWEKIGRPRDFWAFKDTTRNTSNNLILNWRKDGTIAYNDSFLVGTTLDTPAEEIEGFRPLQETGT